MASESALHEPLLPRHLDDHDPQQSQNASPPSPRVESEQSSFSSRPFLVPLEIPYNSSGQSTPATRQQQQPSPSESVLNSYTHDPYTHDFEFPTAENSMNQNYSFYGRVPNHGTADTSGLNVPAMRNVESPNEYFHGYPHGYSHGDSHRDSHGHSHGDSHGGDSLESPVDYASEFPGDLLDWEEMAGGLEAWHLSTAGNRILRRQWRNASMGRSEEPLTWSKILCIPWNFIVDREKSFTQLVYQGYQDIQKDQKLINLSFKAGLGVLLTAIICVLPPPLDSFSSIGVWAVVTVDCVFESNVGLAFSKGVNRLLGTFAAGFLAVIFNHIGPLFGWFHPVFVVFCCFSSTVVMTFYKYKAPFKDRWNYAVVMALLTFHILILTGYYSIAEELILVPLSRFGMIFLAFLVVSLINITIKPAYAGDSLHSLLTKNFGTASKILERCVDEYEKGTVLDHGPEVWNQSTQGDDVTVESLPKLYRAVVQSDAEVDKLMGTVPFEPCHGRFFYGYPWHLYNDITDFLRYAVYDIVGLDSCLRAEIQAPLHLRLLLKNEVDMVAKPCCKILRVLATSMERHAWVDVGPTLRKAEEAALILQHRVCKNIPFMLGIGDKGLDPHPNHKTFVKGSPGSYGGSMKIPSPISERNEQANFLKVNCGTNEIEQKNAFPSASSLKSPSRNVTGEPDFSISEDVREENGTASTLEEGREREVGHTSGNVTPVTSASQKLPPGLPKAPSITINPKSFPSILGFTKLPSPNTQPLTGTESAVPGDMGNMVSKREFLRNLSGEENIHVGGEGEAPVLLSNAASRNSTPRTSFSLRRQNSIEAQWAGTVERISALSLVKFTSLLLEIVAKMKHVVDAMDELALAAKFDGADSRKSQIEVDAVDPPVIDVEKLKKVASWASLKESQV